MGIPTARSIPVHSGELLTLDYFAGDDELLTVLILQKCTVAIPRTTVLAHGEVLNVQRKYAEAIIKNGLGRLIDVHGGEGVRP